MNLADLSVRRPVFITCIIILMLATGYLCLKRLPVDLYPTVNFPIVFVRLPYPGAGPKEIENLVSKVVEDELYSMPGLKSLRSTSSEGLSSTVLEFSLDTDIKSAESQVRDRVQGLKRKLPDDVLDASIRRLDPADQPIISLAVRSALGPAQLYEIADDSVRPKLEQINDVGLVSIQGGRKREIQVAIDQKKLNRFGLSASTVVQRLKLSGQSTPVGKVRDELKDTTYRSTGDFNTFRDIANTIVSFLGNDVPVKVGDIATVADGLQEKNSESFINGEPILQMMVFKQSGANTVKVAEDVKAQINTLNESFKKSRVDAQIEIVKDQSLLVAANVFDVYESIILGIILTFLVVYLFLGSFRSTIITSLALPNSLLGAFILMMLAGFTINTMSLLALSLAVGLLVDDAIVVRENIFRYLERGKKPREAAVEGTAEVRMAVIATTLAVISVFGPIAFMGGIAGQFFKQFGLTICFAMLISLFDALTIAPMLSAYFAGKHTETKQWFKYSIGLPVYLFEKFQVILENLYEKFLRQSLRAPWLALIVGFGTAFGLMVVAKKVKISFMAPPDNGEFSVGLELPPGTSLFAMAKEAHQVDKLVRQKPVVALSQLTVGSRDGSGNVADIYVKLVPYKQRPGITTSKAKEELREDLRAQFAHLSPKVKDTDTMGGGGRAFTLNLIGPNLEELETYAKGFVEKLRTLESLKEVDVDSRPSKPEFRVVIDRARAERFGVSTSQVGQELRILVEGDTSSVFRENDTEYEIRVRLKDRERQLKEIFHKSYIPNINNIMIKLDSVARLEESQGPTSINRTDRGRYVSVSADISAKGGGMKEATEYAKKLLESEMPLKPGMRYKLIGQAENFQDLINNLMLALGFALLFIYLVLASLYESFVLPLTIMSILPLGLSGAVFALWSLDKFMEINAMIGGILLIGIAAKNSILLVDFANQRVIEGVDRKQAMIEAGKTRLRPILMTTVALIAGMLPVAIGLNEVSRQRTSMGVAIIGGLISSTILGLIVVPAAYVYIEAIRNFFIKHVGRRIISADES